VVTQLRQAAGSGEAGQDAHVARTMFDVAEIVGQTLRHVIDQDGKYVDPYGDPSASFLVGGQIAGEPPRLFEIYSAGNFVEASSRSSFLQIGETKYGKPILDRALATDSSLDQAAKLALLSFDATLRSNLSCGMPIDILRYDTDSFNATNLTMLKEEDTYWNTLRNGYGDGLAGLVKMLPPPPDWRV
jgi:putative proteasome-type protease